MIKATIQNSPYCMEIRFPCSETELSKKLGEIKMNPENLAPMATVIEIEPAELSMLTDCDVSLDALNYLGKRLDGMDESEHKQYLAALSCPEISEGWGLKNMINLTYNLARYTLIEDTDDLERIEDAPFSVKVFKFFGNNVLLEVNGEERLYILAAISSRGKSVLVERFFYAVQVGKNFFIFQTANTHYNQKFPSRGGIA